MNEAAAGAAAGVPPLVLASASPRRAELLRMLGLRFDIVPAAIEETMHRNEAAPAAVERLALEKAADVAARRPDALVVGSDTVVVLDEAVLGKPTSPEDAARMLLQLQGREHRVATGVAVVAPDGRKVSSAEIVRVRFRSFDEMTALQYVATGEPLDKAGAYGIQGYGATLVDSIRGDYFAVMGLPVARLVSLFHALGWRYTFDALEPMP